MSFVQFSMRYKTAVNTAIILAGGLGTRLRSVVPELPKPMAPVGGRPFLEHQLDYWIGQGVTRFVISVGYRHELITGHFGDSYRGVSIAYVIEDIPLGTGGGLLMAYREVEVDEPFLVLNGDTYFAVPLNALLENLRVNDADWCFSLFKANEQGRYMGMSISPEGKIVSLKSGAEYPGRMVNGGVYLVHPRALLDIELQQGTKVSLEDDILPAALFSGQRLFGMACSGLFIDIGVPSDYHRAQALFSR